MGSFVVSNTLRTTAVISALGRKRASGRRLAGRINKELVAIDVAFCLAAPDHALPHPRRFARTSILAVVRPERAGLDPTTEMPRGAGKRGGRYALVRVFLQSVVVDRHDAHEGRTLRPERDFEKIAHDLHGVAHEQALWAIENLAEVHVKSPLNSVLSSTGDRSHRVEPAVLGTSGVNKWILLLCLDVRNGPE